MQFSVEIDELKMVRGAIDSVKDEIKSVRNTVLESMNSRVFAGSEFRGIERKLEQISEDLMREVANCEKLADALEKICMLYKEADMTIAGTALEVADETNNQNNQSEQNGTVDLTDIPIEEILTSLFGAGNSPDFSELMNVLGDEIYDYIIDKINCMSDEELLIWYELLRHNGGPFQNTIQYLGLNHGPGMVAQYLNNYMHWQMDSKKENYIIGDTGYIECQSNLRDYRYGTGIDSLGEQLFGEEMTAAHNACEVIAVYNALTQLGDGTPSVDFPALLYHFSKEGIAMNGCLGTSPLSVNRYLQDIGYETDMLTGDDICTDNIQQMQDGYDTYILTAYNEAGNVEAMIHTVSITCEGEPKHYNIHNDNSYNSETGKYGDEYNIDYNSLQEAIDAFNGGKGDPISVIGIK